MLCRIIRENITHKSTAHTHIGRITAFLMYLSTTNILVFFMVGFNCSPKPQRIVLLRLMEYIQTLMKPIFPRHRMKQNRANYSRLYMRTWMTTGVKNTQKENNFLPKQAAITMKNTKKSGCRVGEVLKSCLYPGFGGGGGGGGDLQAKV